MSDKNNEAGELFPAKERSAELAVKQQRIQDFLATHELDALLVSRHENIAWATAGLVEMRVAIPRETAAGSLLFTRGGGCYYLTTNNEAPRLAQEEFAHLNYEPVIQPWYAYDALSSVRKIIGRGKAAADDASSGMPAASLKSLRLQLTEGEMARYRWLGEHVAEAVTEALFALRPGCSEAEMQAVVSAQLLAQRILPSVLLTAADDRIRSYRHAVPREGVLHRFGMLNLCARRWGLVISITRYIYFGRMPAELEEKFAAVAGVNAALLHATGVGATADSLFTVAQTAYAKEGYPGEEQMHHQGGATGYWEREWIARPGGTEQVMDRPGHGMDSSVQGAKIEDTVILCGGELIILTETPRLPLVESRYSGRLYRSAGVLQV
jgi:Xaa-Pro dipeptidase